jgi:hypothetical protein
MPWARTVSHRTSFSRSGSITVRQANRHSRNTNQPAGAHSCHTLFRKGPSADVRPCRGLSRRGLCPKVLSIHLL